MQAREHCTLAQLRWHITHINKCSQAFLSMRAPAYLLVKYIVIKWSKIVSFTSQHVSMFCQLVVRPACVQESSSQSMCNCHMHMLQIAMHLKSQKLYTFRNASRFAVAYKYAIKILKRVTNINLLVSIHNAIVWNGSCGHPDYLWGVWLRGFPCFAWRK